MQRKLSFFLYFNPERVFSKKHPKNSEIFNLQGASPVNISHHFVLQRSTYNMIITVALSTICVLAVVFSTMLVLKITHDLEIPFFQNDTKAILECHQHRQNLIYERLNYLSCSRYLRFINYNSGSLITVCFSVRQALYLLLSTDGALVATEKSRKWAGG